MGKEDGLAALEVGVAGDDGGGVFFRAVEQGLLESGDGGEQAVDLGAGVETGVGGDLVVAGTGGVEFRARRADAAGEFGLDVHVDVLERGLELEFPGLDVGEDFLQAGFDLGKLFFGEQADGFLSTRMGDGPGDVVREQPPVIRNGFAELLDERRGILREAAFPHGIW